MNRPQIALKGRRDFLSKRTPKPTSMFTSHNQLLRCLIGAKTFVSDDFRHLFGQLPAGAFVVVIFYLFERGD